MKILQSHVFFLEFDKRWIDEYKVVLEDNHKKWKSFHNRIEMEDRDWETLTWHGSWLVI